MQLENIFQVRVIPDLKQAIMAGKYDWVSPSIMSIVQEHAPPKTTRECEISLFSPDRVPLMRTNETFFWLKRAGYRSANFDEFLGLGANYLELPQCGLLILTLATVKANPTLGGAIPILERSALGDRHLGISQFSGDWSGFCRFAAVRL